MRSLERLLHSPRADPTVPGMAGSKWSLHKHLLDLFFFYVFTQSQKCKDLNRHCNYTNFGIFQFRNIDLENY